MLKQTRTILSLIVITALLLGIILLSIPACTSNQEKGVDLPPPKPPEKGNPKLGSPLDQLIEAEKQGEAESFASRRDIELVDGGVTVIIECVPGQVDAAAEAATNAGAKQVRVRSKENWVKALVPITSLTALAEAESIRLIRLPVYGVEEAE